MTDTSQSRDDNSVENQSLAREFGCDMVVFGTFIFSVVVLILPTFLLFCSKGYLFSRRQPSTTSSLPPSPPSSIPSTKSQISVPFILLRESDSSSRKSLEETLRSTFSGYQKTGSNAMTGLSTMLDKALISEADRNYNFIESKKSKFKSLLSTKIEQRIHQTAICIEHDEHILKQLLGNFSYVLALPDKPNKEIPREDVNDSKKEEILEGRGTTFFNPSIRVMNESDMHTYDSAVQIWAHLMRDWTREGRHIRHIIYDWCIQEMENYCFKSATVLVPGAGMGRLAYDLSRRGHHVEANELSPSMAAAASSVLRNQTSGTFHPYVLDAMSNEVDSKRRFDFVSFPDISINDPEESVRGSLSYTVGDFVGENDQYYYRRQRAGHFDAVVTCFFIDTATDVYEYLDTIKELLKPETGLWINIGPVQWHNNAILRPSVDELKDLIETFGWSILVWSIDNTAISYRDESNAQFARTTSYEGYRCLRFVVIRSQ